MTTRALFLCDGAPVPQGIQAAGSFVRKTVDWRSPTANLNLAAQNLADTVLTAVDRRAADLVRIAAYVYFADQEISRGGATDIYGTEWRREMLLAIPVSDPSFWSREAVQERLGAVLAFLTEDTWRFVFSQLHPGSHRLPLEFDPNQVLQHPNCVVLFSGGADSLCAVVELMSQYQLRPLLVSHRSSPLLDGRQRRLVRLLRERSGQPPPPHISFWIHRVGQEAVDSAQRSRGFLFACLGAAVASQLGLARVVMSDNGVVSLNLPINEQLVGALASRSTHPKFLWLFNGLLSAVFDAAVVVENTLALRTRAEVLGLLKVARCEELLQETVSCSRTRGRPNVFPHCGFCSQCVDRRFGSIAAGMDDCDLAERYELDIFTQDLPEGEPRTVCESYVRFARRVKALEPETMFWEIPQLTDTIIPGTPRVHETADALTAMLKRHADGVISVLGTMIERWRDELADGPLPQTCLLRLATGAEIPAPRLSDSDERYLFRREGAAWRVRFADKGAIVRDSDGMAYIAELLRVPGRAISVTDLDGMHTPRPTRKVARDDVAGLQIGDVGELILSPAARQDLRVALNELADARAEAEREDDQITLDQINRVTEQLQHQLDAATGIGGRPRKMSGERERVRNRVRRAIARAFTGIGEQHPELGHHLARTIAKGWEYVYQPGSPTRWLL